MRVPTRPAAVLLCAALLAGCAPAAVRTPPAPAALPAARAGYPAHWWAPVAAEGHPPAAGPASWEVLPQAAGPGEVIVSKRHELGLLSNFAATPFVYRGKRYASVEGFWQMMLYPEGPDDPRARFVGIEWPHTRDEVAAMTAFDAKRAGELAWQNMQRMRIGWVSFEGRRFAYRSARPGRHHRLILAAMREKLRQNPEVRKVLLSTGDLVLRPDHHQESDAPPEWRYCEIWMRMRAEVQREGVTSRPGSGDGRPGRTVTRRRPRAGLRGPWMNRFHQHLDPASWLVLLVTLVLFVVALFVKGLGHDLLLEAGVFLVSVKLIMMMYKAGASSRQLAAELAAIRAALARLEAAAAPPGPSPATAERRPR